MAKKQSIWDQLDALNKLNAENAADEAATAKKTPAATKKRRKKRGLVSQAKNAIQTRDERIDRAIRRATGGATPRTRRP